MNYLVAYTLSLTEVGTIRRMVSPIEIAPKSMPLHVTLVAPGEARMDVSDAIHEFQDMTTLEPAEADVAGLATFGTARRPVLAIELRLNPDLAQLQGLACTYAAKWQNTGLSEYRPFAPHITVWRGANHETRSLVHKRLSLAPLTALRLRMEALDLYAKESSSDVWKRIASVTLGVK